MTSVLVGDSQSNESIYEGLGEGLDLSLESQNLFVGSRRGNYQPTRPFNRRRSHNDIEIMKQFFDKILALKDNDGNRSMKNHNKQIINDKVKIKEEKKIEKVKSKDRNQICDVTLACEDKQIRCHKILISIKYQPFVIC